MGTIGHEEEIVNVEGLEWTLQKLKTAIIDKKFEKPEGGISAEDLDEAINAVLEDAALAASDVSSHVEATNNPHSVTKKQVGLENVGNFKAVSTEANQGLTDAEKTAARQNIGAGTSSFDGNYNSLTNKPTIPDAQVQSDWNQSDETKKDFIKNKPTIPVNTDTKVTSVDNHYSPSANGQSELTASLDGEEGAYNLGTEYSVVTGIKIQRDAKGHVTGINVTKQKVKDTNTDTTYSNVTTSADGLMSSTDKSKLDNIESGAQKHKAPTSQEVKSALGTGEGTEKFLREDGTFAKPAYTTNTDTKCTGVDNHYSPEANNDSQLTASTEGEVGAYTLNTEYEVVTGVKVQRDAKGHVTGIKVTKQKIKDTDTDTTYGNASASQDGLMSSVDKSKLNGIENGAQKHVPPTAEEVKNALGTGEANGKFLNNTGGWSDPFSGLVKQKVRVVNVSADLSNQTTSIANDYSETVVFVNNGSTDYSVGISSSYKTPDGEPLELVCPQGGYCEVSFLKVSNVVYVRGM